VRRQQRQRSISSDTAAAVGVARTRLGEPRRCGGVRSAIVLALTVGCGLDPLRLSERRVSEHVSLRKFPEDTYYIVTDLSRARGAILDGSVQRIGWHERVIIVQRIVHKAIEWVLSDPLTGEVSKLSDDAAVRAHSSAVAALPTIRADSAWAQLQW
jgi:hypothetical protein